MIGVGLFLLVMGGGLSLLSYLNRDPVTGEYFLWIKSLISGGILTVLGFVWRAKENQPLF